MVRFLRDNGHPQAERRSLRGGEDWGDITGIPGVCWEVKAGKTLRLAEWLRETDRERVNARAEFGVLVIKPVGMGATRTGQWWAAMYEGDYAYLMSQMNQSGHFTWIESNFFKLSGSKIKYLSQTMKENMHLHHAILIAPKGVKIQSHWYVVTTLERLNDQLRAAGYGDA